MLPKKYRLTKRGSFDYVYRKGTSQKNCALILVYLRGKGFPKTGFSVSNKLGKAVTRNKIKRRLRNAFREYLPYVDKAQLIFVAKEPIKELTYLQIKNLMGELLIKSKLLRNEKN